jgi:hypothetical protein
MNEPTPLDVRDLENLQKSIEAAIDRGAFSDHELEIIIPLSKKLADFLSAYNSFRK